MQKPGIAFGHLMLTSLSDVVVPAMGILLYVESPLIGALVDLGCLIRRNKLGWVLLPSSMVTPDVVVPIPMETCRALRRLLRLHGGICWSLVFNCFGSAERITAKVL
jgi:hypothetical protein